MAASNAQTMAPTIVEDDDLFELDIGLLGRRDDDDDGRDDGHVLLANCLLPVSSVSSAVPVAGGAIVSTTSYPYAGYCSSRRLFTGSSSSSKRFLFGRSARFCFSSRGFETMGNYFQRY